MSIFSMLYKLLIGPLQLFFDVLYTLTYRVIGNVGLSIIFLSLAMNFLVLPLYRQADAMQAQERELEKKLQPWVAHIKRTFTGDEHFMILQTFYRQNGYKPTYALKGSLSLLLEVPFFIAAYQFLSHLQLLNGVSFGPIRDLGAPDAMFVVAGFTVNILPILMTAINFVSGFIYTRGFPLKSKLQLYAMALVFLVFLYQSPAGLVFYWTLNNVFSLVKNIFYKLKNPRLVLCLLASAAGLALLGSLLIMPHGLSPRRLALFIVLSALLELPICLYLLRKRLPRSSPVSITGSERRSFYLGCAFLTILTGLLIPTAIIRSSPAEFVNVMAYRSPLLYVLSALLLAAGAFMIWCGIFYMLSGDGGKRIMGCGVWALSGVALVNYMGFGRDLGNLSSLLVFDTAPVFTGREILINLLAACAVAGILYVIWRSKKQLVSVALLSACIAMVCMSAVNVSGISRELDGVQERLDTVARDLPSIPLSKEGKNVVVIMMDRAIGSYLPYLFHEKPELGEQFAGFTYYPNTLSFGHSTNLGSPALFGGYEYTPEELNKRSDEPLYAKQNEALRVMPVLFDENRFAVTVCDPPYAGYSMVPDLTIYDDYPNIRKFITMGRYSLDGGNPSEQTEHLRQRNMFCYSIFKIVPLLGQEVLYSGGTYNEANALMTGSGLILGGQTRDGLSRATGVGTDFAKAYAVLRNLNELTQILPSDRNTFTMLANDTSHEPTLLQEPSYEPAQNVDNTEYDALHAQRTAEDGRSITLQNELQMTHYHVNMATLLQLGNWMDYLRQSGVYDNTRIIIVSDHGRNLRQYSQSILAEDDLDLMWFNPLLLVKDFDSHTFTVDDTFMTNGDVPTLAVSGLIDDPVNPFTGQVISNEAKFHSEMHVHTSEWNTTINNGNTFLPGNWYAMHDQVLDPGCWRKIDAP